MLVLSRKPGETLKIGDDITVRVLSVRGNVVRIGVDAPRNVRVLRGELHDWNCDDSLADDEPAVVKEMALSLVG